MRIKYYLRGLGTGILVTTIIITISNSIRDNEEKMKQITGQPSTGAYYQTKSLSDEESKSAQESTDASHVRETSSPGESAGSTGAQTQATAASKPAATTAPSAEPTSPRVPTQSVTSEIVISFNSVSSSESASKLLEDAGIVDDWREFNTFLVNNGYDRKISNGTFTFMGNETYEEIAELIINGR